MKKNKISTYFLFISIFTFVAVFFFVVQNSYSNLMKPIKQVQTSNYLKPINPNLDISVLDQISQRQHYSSDTSTPSASTPTPTP